MTFLRRIPLPVQWRSPAGVALLFAVGTLCASGSTLAQDAAAKASPAPQEQGLWLPAWAEKSNWKAIARPIEEAIDKGGKLTLQLPKALERQIILAKNGGRAGEIRVAEIVVGGRVNANEQMEQQIKALVPQYRQQYIHILHNELESARSFCDIPKEAREEVYKAAEAAYDKALEEFVREMHMPTNRAGRGGALRSDVRNAIVAALEKKLPPAEFSKLSETVRERAELRKRVCVETLLARLDDVLRLTSEQRDKISESVRAEWLDEWEAWLMLWHYDENYFPQVKDSLIATHLTPQQRRIWQQTQKISLRGSVSVEFSGEFDAAYWGAEPIQNERRGRVILLER